MTEVRFAKTYELVAKYKFETSYLPDFSGLKGIIDPHLHAGARRTDPVSLARLASQAGMKALLFKTSQVPTVEMARIVTDVTRNWAESQNLTPVLCFGGTTLNLPSGGLNLDLVKYCTETGGKAVWFPTLTSANHQAKTKGIPFSEAKKFGISLMEDGKLKKQVTEIFGYAIEKNIILSFGHASRDEMFAMAEYGAARGFKKMLIDHPFDPVSAGLTEEELVQMVDEGVNINLTFFEISPLIGVDPMRMVNLIQKTGPDHVILSSDAGQPILPNPVECIRSLIAILQVLGIEKEWMHSMTVINPGRLLGDL